MREASLFAAILPTADTAISPGLHLMAYPLASRFANVEAESPSVRYYTFNTATAAVVAERAAKSDAGVAVIGVDVVLEKFASTYQFSDEFANDAGFLFNHLSAELASAVVLLECAPMLEALAPTVGILTESVSDRCVRVGDRRPRRPYNGIHTDGAGHLARPTWPSAAAGEGDRPAAAISSTRWLAGPATGFTACR